MGYEIFQIKPDLNSPCFYLLKTLGCKSMTPSNWAHVNPFIVKLTAVSLHTFSANNRFNVEQ